MSPSASVRFIRPNADFPEIRLRFTPAKGLIYGPRPAEGEDADPAIPADRAIYDPRKGTWRHFEAEDADETVPPSLFAIVPPAPSWLHDNMAVSRGYFDDACDGHRRGAARRAPEGPLTAVARICAGPPAVVPDSLFVRCLADDLEQVIARARVLDPDEPAR